MTCVRTDDIGIARESLEKGLAVEMGDLTAIPDPEGGWNTHIDDGGWEIFVEKHYSDIEVLLKDLEDVILPDGSLCNRYFCECVDGIWIEKERWR